MRDLRELKAWEKSHSLTLAVYKATATSPKEELDGLTSQIRRSASSIPANIAEGCGRDGAVELARFLRIAPGSASEPEYHALLAYEPNLLDPSDHRRLTQGATEVKRMLTSFIQKLKS